MHRKIFNSNTVFPSTKRLSTNIFNLKSYSVKTYNCKIPYLPSGNGATYNPPEKELNFGQKTVDQ